MEGLLIFLESSRASDFAELKVPNYSDAHFGFLKIGIQVDSRCCRIVNDDIKACVICKQTDGGMYVFNDVIDIIRKSNGPRMSP